MSTVMDWIRNDRTLRLTKKPGGRVVGYVVAYVARNGEKGYRSWDDPSGFHFSGRRQVFATLAQAQQLRDYSSTPAPPTPERKVFRVVRYPKKSWGVWCTPKAGNPVGIAQWCYLGSPYERGPVIVTTRAYAEQFVSKWQNTPHWHYEVRRYSPVPDAPRAKYIIRKRRPIEYSSAAAAREVAEQYQGGLLDWKVVRVK